MPYRLFILLERLQRLDERLRLTRAQPTSNPLEVLRLTVLRRALRDRISLSPGRDGVLAA